MITTKLILLLLLKTCLCHDLDQLFNKINEEFGNFSTTAASLAWDSSIHPNNPDLPARAAKYLKNRIIWQHHTCNSLATLLSRHSLNSTQQRQTYLLCRGPKFTYEETRLTSKIYEELQSIYSDSEICIPSDLNSTQNLSQIEDAILNYLSNVKQFLGIEHEDYILFAAKIAVNRNVKEKEMFCLKSESDIDKLMAFSRKEEVLKWLWLVWREKIGPPMKEPYRELVEIENKAARRNGYQNIGAAWRDELEIPQLRLLCRRLYNEVKPLYTLLHGVIRYYLRQQYGDVVPKRGLIPAHLLGDLWSQNWEPLEDLLLTKTIDLDASIKKLNWTVTHMVKRAEDFYQSLGLPAMTDKFWRESVFARENNSDTRCHGTAADMFQHGDFRLLYCSGTSMEDFYVLHHELGHIQYYMAYEQQPALFKQANTALHETIGDTIMYGVLTPQHLNRLGLINDSLLYTYNTDHINELSTENLAFINNQDTKRDTKQENDGENIQKSKDNNEEIHSINDLLTDVIKTETYYKYSVNKEQTKSDVLLKENEFNHDLDGNANVKETFKLLDDNDVTTDIILLLKQALNKIPQIPFALVMDEYRWKYFEGRLKGENKEFWDMVEELQGIGAPSKRGEHYFDVGAKFHVPDNTPYIRYFLSSFLQHQLFEKLCQAAVFGRRSAETPIPASISLSRCDIYGSKAAGKILKDFMSRGHSQHWREILQATTGDDIISAESLNRYYQPLFNILEKFVRAHRVPIGW